MTVLNKRTPGLPLGAVYIGRPSKWENPFTISKQQSRERCIELFRWYLRGRPDLQEAARRELAGRDLVCWCAPAACHGDVLARVAAGGEP